MMLGQTLDKPSPNVPQNGNFSPELYDFIDRCLKKEPTDRDTAVGLLAHPWIRSGAGANLPKYLKELQIAN